MLDEHHHLLVHLFFSIVSSVDFTKETRFSMVFTLPFTPDDLPLLSHVLGLSLSVGGLMGYFYPLSFL